MAESKSAATVIAETQCWLERAVIGLNLCPFAKAVYAKEQIRFAVSVARTPETVLHELERELTLLSASDPQRIDTTLLILPEAFPEFLDFFFFLREADAVLERVGMKGTIQIASFHPHFEFAGNDSEDIANYTNRAPYPVLHLLREASVARAVAAFPDAADIYERNIRTLRQLGYDGWRALFATHKENSP